MRRLIPLLLILVALHCGASINICGIGDSIMFGAGTSPTTSPLLELVNSLNNACNCSNYVAQNRGISGTTSVDWASTSGGSDLVNAVSAFISAGGCKVVLYMIGTNDSQYHIATTGVAYKANVIATVNYILAQMTTSVMLCYSPYINLVLADPSIWNSGSLGLLQNYQGQINTIVATTSGVMLGDTTAYTYFSNNLLLLNQTGAAAGVHPTHDGAVALGGTLWSKIYLHATTILGTPSGAALIAERRP